MTNETSRATRRASRFTRMLPDSMLRMRTALAAGTMLLASGCQDFLDVNTNPNAPQEVSANLYLAPMLDDMVSAQLWDGRFIGQYTQQWMNTGFSNWRTMGYDRGSDNGGQQFRATYFVFGQNLSNMIRQAEAEQRWDLLGVGQVLRAWGWHVNTGHSGEIPVQGTFDPSKTAFAYDSQEFVYGEVQRLLDEAIKNLSRTDGAVDETYLGRTDHIYKGDREKWLKFAWGLKAIALNHFSNKASYKPAEVIAAVDKSFTSNADDALVTYIATNNFDTNFWGATRSNLTPYRQTEFVVNLMNGTNFGAGTVDPRMSRMLAPSADGQYRGLDNDISGGGLTAALLPRNFWGYTTQAEALRQPARYIFDDKSKVPAMTYAQLQLVKAEAALRSGDRATALTAYRNGVNAHFDFVNARNLDANQAVTQISAAERAAYLANPAVMPTNPANLTLTMIMVQKYITQWAWGHNELWMDMRRYHYTDRDPATGAQVYPGFNLPATFFADNGGRPAYRIRTRFNSEYVWNLDELTKVGADAPDYHTKPLWITEP